jgi:hypothetical protein
MKENKRMYTAPAMERIPVEPGMVMAGSLTGYDGVAGSSIFSTTTSTPTTSGHTFAGHSDVESMINDILTVEP